MGWGNTPGNGTETTRPPPDVDDVVRPPW